MNKLIITIVIVCFALVAVILFVKQNHNGVEDMNSVVAIDITELTDNNFVKGLDYTFTQDEVGKFKDLLKNAKFKQEKLLSRNRMKKKYILYLYDQDDMELASYAVDDKLIIHTDDRKFIDETDVKNYLEDLINNHR